jgi:PAS domain S-box-containing protein
LSEDYLGKMNLRLSGEPLGPAAFCLKAQRHIIVKDICRERGMADCHEEAERLGFRSCAAFPVTAAGMKPVCLNLYAGENNFFDPSELAVLDQLANDIAFAMEFAGQEEGRRRTERLLEESEQRYHTLARISPVGIFQTDADGVTTYVNPKWCAISGMSASDALGNGWLKAVHPEDRERLMQGWQESAKSHRPSYADYRFIRPDGSLAWVMGQAVPEMGPHKQVKGYVGTITDITERKETEAALQASEQQLSLIYEKMSDVLFYMAVEPEDRFRFISINGAFLRVTGLREEQVVGKTMQEVIPPGSRALVLRNYKKAIRTCKPVSWEEISEYPTGKKYGEVTVSPVFDGEGNCTHLIGTVHDITDRKQAEAEIRKLNAELERRVEERTAQLAAANKELEAFSYSVSHDLRAPLRAISGFAEIISRRHRESLNEEGRHYFDNIVQASEHMGHLIDDLLTYARLGRSGVRREQVSLGGLLGEICKHAQPQLDSLGGKLTLQKNMPTITSDSTLLSQVFINLLENALKYHKPNTPPQISITCEKENHSIVVKVSDRGIGIPAEHQEKIFNVFQRLHSEDEYPGTGIGLASVRKSVELLGGKVWVESAPGEGSTFFVRLPRE